MGKGDIKTRKGKVAKGTFGVRRPKKRTPMYIPVEKPAAKKATPKKAAPKKEAPKKATPKKTKTTSKKADKKKEE